MTKKKQNRFTDEEVKSDYGYLSGYKPKPITEQVNCIKQFFPELKDATYNEKLVEQPFPAGAEGWFAIPCWQSIAKTYNEAVKKVLELIKQQRKGDFLNCRECKLGENYFRQHERTAKNLKALADQQRGYDVLVVPAQFGLRHRSRSVYQARDNFTDNEFGLSVFEIGCMLLTHPERLQHYNDLWIDCAGDEYTFPAAINDFSHAPCFLFSMGMIGFAAYFFDSETPYIGSASGFLP